MTSALTWGGQRDAESLKAAGTVSVQTAVTRRSPALRPLRRLLEPQWSKKQKIVRQLATTTMRAQLHHPLQIAPELSSLMLLTTYLTTKAGEMALAAVSFNSGDFGG